MAQTYVAKSFRIMSCGIILLAFVLQLVAYCTPDWLVVEKGGIDTIGLFSKEGKAGDRYLLSAIILFVFSLFCLFMAFSLGVASSIKRIRQLLVMTIIIAILALATGTSGTCMVHFFREQILQVHDLDANGARYGYSFLLSLAANTCELAAIVILFVSLTCTKDDHGDLDPLPQEPEVPYHPPIFFGVRNFEKKAPVTDPYLQQDVAPWPTGRYPKQSAKPAPYDFYRQTLATPIY